LPDQLIKTLLRNNAVSLIVGIDAMIVLRRLAVDAHAEAHGFSIGGGPENEMKIARVKAIGDASVLRVERRALSPDRPVAGERPLIGLQLRGSGIDLTLVGDRAAESRLCERSGLRSAAPSIPGRSRLFSE
jgi:hypothetical protein